MNPIIGGPGNDTLPGTSAADLIDGNEGSDSLLGAQGNDSLLGEGGLDTLFGGIGNDTLNGGVHDDFLDGDGGSDLVLGGDGDDTLVGGDFGEIGVDTLDGGDGDDLLLSAQGSSGLVRGGTGFDTFIWRADASVVEVTIGDNALTGPSAPAFTLQDIERIGVETFGGTARITGSANADTILSRSAVSQIDAGAGNDVVAYEANGNFHVLDGGTGDDVLQVRLLTSEGDMTGFSVSDATVSEPGGSNITGFERYMIEVTGDGLAFVEAGSGNDSLYASASGTNNLSGRLGDDLLVGEAGGDRLNGDEGNDTLLGGAGDDDLDGWLGNDSLIGGDGNDQLDDDAGDSTLFGGAGHDSITFGGGRRSVSIVDAGAGNDTVSYFHYSQSHAGEVDGGAGIDRLNYTHNFGNDVELIIGNGTLSGASAPAATIGNFEFFRVAVSAENVNITGSIRADDISVLGNNVVVNSMGGDDIVEYTDRGFAHQLDGGTGRDLLQVNLKSNGLTTQSFIVSGDTATDGSGSTITGFESYRISIHSDDHVEVRTGRNADTVASGDGGNLVEGMGGDDWLSLGKGNDTVEGGAGNDTVSGWDGRDLLLGGAGNDIVGGGDDDDILRGGDGNDSIDGGAGSDFLFGGAGSDRFRLTFGGSIVDRFGDYETGSDVLLLARSLINNALPFGATPDVGQGGPTGTTGQFYTTYAAGPDRTTLIWDSNGTNAGGENQIATLDGNLDLGVGDLLIT